MHAALIIPTRNAAPWLDRLIPAIQRQRPTPYEVLVIDSDSSDGTPQRCREAGFRVHGIALRDFDHGGTRRLATHLVTAEHYVFLTQDAIPASEDAIDRLLASFDDDEQIGLVYGRQLPHKDAGALGAHARQFNYPAESRTKALSDKWELGIKTCFASDAFAAYRRRALVDAGGFPERAIGSEDAFVAAQMLLKGWKVHYEADACVHHSHDYTFSEQFRRYFDIGVFYGRERWITEAFGEADGEGRRFAASELRYLREAGRPWLIPCAIMHSASKWLGYRLGERETHLPRWLKRRFSMLPRFWEREP